jgi:cytochrome c peroxidase
MKKAWLPLLLLGAIGLSGVAGAVGQRWLWHDLPARAKAPPVPAGNPMSAAKVALGRRLFYDADLSRDGTLACAGCHEQKRGFAEGSATHMGVTGEPGIRNAPGLANVAWRTPLTWSDATLHTLEQQAMVPLTGEHPVEMGMKGGAAEIARRLSRDPCYRRMFAAAFPASGERIDFPQIGAALAAFERTLISSGSAWDRRETSPLPAPARTGAAQFAALGCAGCHSGADLTDNRFHYVGTGPVNMQAGYGRTDPNAEEEAQMFRTPSLRNAAVTGPWLHDGSAASLDDAIRRHAPGAAARADMPALLAFLGALTDERFLRNPAFARPVSACPTAG